MRDGTRASEAATATARRSLWGRRIGLLPQESWLALDSTMRVLDKVAETHLFVRGASSLAAARERARGDLASPALPPKKGQALADWTLPLGRSDFHCGMLKFTAHKPQLVVDAINHLKANGQIHRILQN
ncbi:ABC-type dipeptide/oligopeptide/nickel transport system ATPase component [Hydrogenophaga palleronii]|uniref:ABC-type dipeptide/oligopeptide/nickel transport system ATPase component n=1 Tax=Hydrogenophaga palleronii TaxID=65655 RepID=A0ABU1WPV8_9BURK|nr:hypothetical protein [Hydrogenophaga palleronii]MDR7151328.1 ABC-type dipeptide/oligopeptide/nickel transport system ATPase component [Hydrogenophaga palleronii]